MPPDPRDLFTKAWSDLAKQLQKTPSLLTDNDLSKQLAGPLRAQADLLERAVEAQTVFQREIVDRMLAPARVVTDMLEQTAKAMRTQAKAFEAASEAFAQSSDLLEVQASLLEKTAKSMRDPTEMLRMAGEVMERTASPPRDRDGG